MASLVCNSGFMTPISALVGVAAYLVSDFTVAPAREGPQNIITWGYPNGATTFANNVSEIILVRKLGSYPQSPTDGLVLFTDTPPYTRTYYSDLGIEKGTCHYYTMFSRRVPPVATVVFDQTVIGYAVPFETGEWERRFYEQFLPNIYPRWDKDATRYVPLVPAQATATAGGIYVGEQFNFDADPGEKMGFLRRWLKIVGIHIDEIRERIELIPEFLNVDTTPADYLPFLANLVGLRPNFDIPIPRQRDEVRRAVEIWKRKGREDSILSVINSISGLDAVLKHWRNNILILNSETSRSFSFDPDDIRRMGWYDDTTDYVVGNEIPEHQWQTIAIYPEIPAGIEMTQAIMDKLNRVIGEYIRFPQKWVWFFHDKLEDAADLSGTVEESFDYQEDDVEEVTDLSGSSEESFDYVLSQWMITAEPGVTYGGTNDPVYKTPVAFP